MVISSHFNTDMRLEDINALIVKENFEGSLKRSHSFVPLFNFKGINVNTSTRRTRVRIQLLALGFSLPRSMLLGDGYAVWSVTRENCPEAGSGQKQALGHQ